MPSIVMDMPYDSSDPDDIFRYAKELVGRTLGEVVEERDLLDVAPLHMKGKFGQLIERGYFLIENNSNSEPDFLDAGLELKTTPVKRLKNGDLAPKERLVLSLIDYMEIVDEVFWKSAFIRKNGNLLIMFYLHEDGKPIYDYRIIDAVVWDYGDEDIRIIKEDWEVIREHVRQGRAHELSERLTRYLAANRKGVGHGKDDRRQPYSKIPAPARSFSLKSSYMKTIITRDDDSERLIRSLDEWDEGRTFEGVVLDRLRRFEGMSVESIEKELDVSFDRSVKHRRRLLLNRMLGVTKMKVEEFEKADILIKTVMLNDKDVPREDMSFPTFRYTKILDEEWEDSRFFEQLNRRFLFAVFKKGKDGRERFIKAKFWSMPYEDLLEAERIFEETKRRISAGEADMLPRSTESRVAHVRPHARDSRDTFPLPYGGEMVKKCFWLNRRYVLEQLS